MRASVFCVACLAIGWATLATISATNQGIALSRLYGQRQQQLEEKGLLTIAIRPPTVPEGASRLRLVLRRDLPEGSCSTLVAALGTP